MSDKKASAKKTSKQIFKRPNINLLAPIALLVVALGIILIQVQTPQETRSRAAGDCDIQAGPLEINPQEQQMVNLINNFRQMQGRVPLNWDPRLNYAAAWMAKDMTVTKRINHTDTFGRTPSQRIVVCGVPSGGTFAENVAIGPANADEVFLNWQTTPTEMSNMSNPLFNSVAVGVEYDSSGQGYWAVVFSGPYTGQTISTPVPQPTSIPIVTENPNSGGSIVPSPNCLGACPTMSPNVTLVPNDPINPNDPNNPNNPNGNTTNPTPSTGADPNDPNTTTNPVDPNNPNDPNNSQDPNANDPNNPGNNAGGNGGNENINGIGGFIGGIIGLFLAFLALILHFFLSLIGRG